MPILPIYTYDHPVLRQAATPVADITDDIVRFVASMTETMHNADGIGLAANQVGDSRAIATLDLSDFTDEKTGKPFAIPPITLINPVIEAFSDETNEHEEGCLSLPDFRDKVVRPTGIQVRFYDLQMHEHSMEVTGFLARVMQHEIDHLNGKYFFEHLSPVRRALAHAKLKRIQLGHVATDYPLFNPRNSKSTNLSTHSKLDPQVLRAFKAKQHARRDSNRSAGKV
jgi:peptide deformylase